MTSNILRQKHLKELYEKYIHFVNEECYPEILEIFNEYKKSIKQQTDINYECEKIQIYYEDQCKNSTPINKLHQIITEDLQQIINENSTDSNKIVINETHHTMQKTIKQAIDNSNMLDDIIKQLRQND
jgi:hypothetical protein